MLRADYVLFWKANIPLAIIEAEDNTQAVGAGIQQTLSYAKLLGMPLVFASNGDGFVFRDAPRTTGTLEATLSLDQFPPPAELWARLCAHRSWTPEEQAIASHTRQARRRATTNLTPSTGPLRPALQLHDPPP